MNKITTLGLIMILVSFGASAQIGVKNRIGGRNCINHNRITTVERHELRKDVLRQRTALRIARRDGIITPMERRRIHRLKADTRRDAFRFRNNNRKRV